MRRISQVLVGLVIPAALSAQVLLPTRGRRPDRPTDKPPQAPGIHDARMYNRYKFSRFSIESSPMLAYMQTTGMFVPGAPQSYWGLGDATLISFRTAPSLYLTTGFSASSAGSPFGMNATDVGLRLKPWTAPRMSVFADARMSWAFTSDFGLPSAAVPIAELYRVANRDLSTGRGRGGVFGIGADLRLTDRYSMTATVSRAHYAMQGRDIDTMNRWTYTNDATRFTVGMRYNHGHWLDAPR